MEVKLNMANLIFNVLPYDIQETVFTMRLDYIGADIKHRTYNKDELLEIVKKLPMKYITMPHTHSSISYYSPFDINVCVALLIAVQVLTRGDLENDGNDWVNRIIKPIELGLQLNAMQDSRNDRKYIYDTTDELLLKLILKLRW